MKGILCQLYFVLVVRVSKGFKCTGHEEFFRCIQCNKISLKKMSFKASYLRVVSCAT